MGEQRPRPWDPGESVLGQETWEQFRRRSRQKGRVARSCSPQEHPRPPTQACVTTLGWDLASQNGKTLKLQTQ